MKKILLTSVAMALVGGAASAQSVLERVLSQTQSLGQVTGVFANVADNIGMGSEVVGIVATDASASSDVFITADEAAAAQAAYDAVLAVGVQTDYAAITVGGVTTGYQNTATGEIITPSAWAGLYATAAARTTAAETAGLAQLPGALTWAEFTTGTEVEADISGTINGSITNVVSGLDEVQASVMGTVTAVDVPTVNFGNMATTVLGAVNTGEIGLGTNQVVEEALAGTTQAIRSEIQQIGTLSGLTQVALNSALNTMSINGSISNSLSGVNGSVAAISPDVLEIAMSASDTLSLTGVADLLGSMNTTVLGAVNTGTIVSGVNNQVDGTVAGIVGNSATNMFGATE